MSKAILPVSAHMATVTPAPETTRVLPRWPTECAPPDATESFVHHFGIKASCANELLARLRPEQRIPEFFLDTFYDNESNDLANHGLWLKTRTTIEDDEYPHGPLPWLLKIVSKEATCLRVTETKDLSAIGTVLAQRLGPSSSPNNENLLMQWRLLLPTVVVPTLRLTLSAPDCRLLIDLCDLDHGRFVLIGSLLFLRLDEETLANTKSFKDLLGEAYLAPADTKVEAAFRYSSPETYELLRKSEALSSEVTTSENVCNFCPGGLSFPK